MFDLAAWLAGACADAACSGRRRHIGHEAGGAQARGGRAGRGARCDETVDGAAGSDHPGIARRARARCARAQARRPACRQRHAGDAERCRARPPPARRRPVRRSPYPICQPMSCRAHSPAARRATVCRWPAIRSPSACAAARRAAAGGGADLRPARRADASEEAGDRALVPIWLFLKRSRGADRLHHHSRHPDRPDRRAPGQDFDLCVGAGFPLRTDQPARDRGQGALCACDHRHDQPRDLHGLGQ